jgi:hypothetical protein
MRFHGAIVSSQRAENLPRRRPGFIWLCGSDERQYQVIFLLTFAALDNTGDNIGMPRALFEVKCPCCDAMLKIDGELHAVISHQEAVKKPAFEDLAAEVAKLKGAAGRREEVFQKSFAAEKNQGQVLNRKFDELLKQAKADPEFGKKPRDMDLD